jgi:2-methylfumaryl-CoA hydratase
MVIRAPRYGRKLDDFRPGDVYAHPWDVTIDEGMVAFFAASFQDASPVFASRTTAQALGLRDRPVHPYVLLNLALSFSVQDVSEQTIAHLAYLDVRFPEIGYVGDTVTATSEVVRCVPTSKPDRGIVRVRTVLRNQSGAILCHFDRKALMHAGAADALQKSPWPPPATPDTSQTTPIPQALAGPLPVPARRAGFGGFYEDFDVGDVIAHTVGKTVGESEHMQLTQLCRNTHPLHFDEVYCREHSFAKTRVVYGGLVLSWVLALASRDVAGNALWCAGLDDGAHPAPVVAGDTLYATSKILATEDQSPSSGLVTFRVVGTKNTPGIGLVEAGLFDPELKKPGGKQVPAKVFEITRTLLIRKRR